VTTRGAVVPLTVNTDSFGLSSICPVAMMRAARSAEDASTSDSAVEAGTGTSSAAVGSPDGEDDVDGDDGVDDEGGDVEG